MSTPEHPELPTQTAAFKVVTIPKRALLTSLLLLQAVSFGLAIPMSVYMIPKAREIYTDVLGEDAYLPSLTRFILAGHWLLLIVPLVLGGLTFWACRSERPTTAPAFVMVATVFLTLVFPFVIIGLLLVLLKVVW